MLIEHWAVSTQISTTVKEEKEQQSFFGMQGSRLTGDLRFSFNTKDEVRPLLRRASLANGDGW